MRTIVICSGTYDVENSVFSCCWVGPMAQG